MKRFHILTAAMVLGAVSCGADPTLRTLEPVETPDPILTLTPYPGLTATEWAGGVLIKTNDRTRLVPYSGEFGGEVGGFLPPQGTVFPLNIGARVEVWTGLGWQKVAELR